MAVMMATPALDYFKTGVDTEDGHSTSDAETRRDPVKRELSSCAMSSRPSPAKRIRISNDDPDAQEQMLERSMSRSVSVMNSSSRQGLCLSPQDLEIELRLASEYPLRRLPVSAMREPTTHMKQFATLRTTPVIPLEAKALVSEQSGWAHTPKDSWFYCHQTNPPLDVGATYSDYVHKRIVNIRRNAVSCKQKMEDEASWNESVNSSLLELAFGDDKVTDVSYRNISRCSIQPELRDPNPVLADPKIDYAVLLTVEECHPLTAFLNQLRTLDPSRNHTTHVQLSDGANTPISIGIKTVSGQDDGSIRGNAQLAAWLRAQFRHLASLPKADPENLPIIPFVFVQGASWRIDFAQRTKDELIIWDGFYVGSSDEIHGCYCILAALALLEDWTLDPFLDWFEHAIGAIEKDDDGQVAVYYGKPPGQRSVPYDGGLHIFGQEINYDTLGYNGFGYNG
ncbi:hypothetical protein BKA56DRAFT_662940 [Ilyonectria sp. MPI-CAGE-AT-0026]|nr:hypothetical protein BKA56DRAFT_662940 [Ilyonectria sp. MPI-CAGE-AT-0026]